MNPDPTGRYRVTAAGFLHCIECGCLVMEGYRAEHNLMHVQLSIMADPSGLAAPVPTASPSP